MDKDKKHSSGDRRNTCLSGLIRQFVVGINADPLPLLPPPITDFITISTLTIAIDNPLDTVRFLATIVANNEGSTVDFPSAQLLSYRIRRVAPEEIVISVSDTNIDFVTTTLTAIDRPGVGFFTYVLEGRVPNSAPGNDSDEGIIEVIFTAEEIENNIPC
ncbi:hypothetical protein [Niallia sp. Krafla_26]|uniref:hypothetical protein n=1 Tax=Niallia sp. Krafla_26 TaxID=3064703 RepID=UPI003D167591